MGAVNHLWQCHDMCLRAFYHLRFNLWCMEDPIGQGACDLSSECGRNFAWVWSECHGTETFWNYAKEGGEGDENVLEFTNRVFQSGHCVSQPKCVSISQAKAEKFKAITCSEA